MTIQDITIIWVLLPFVIGFSIYLLPQISRYLALIVVSASLCFGTVQIFQPEPYQMQLLDSFGVTLRVSAQSGYFILTNALVAIAIILYCFNSPKSAFFFTQLTILHGAVNAVFICADLMSLYVALEAIGVAAFLLMIYQRTDRSIWVGLRYLFISNTAMLFFLIGAVQVYQANNSFAYAGLANAPIEAIALLFIGLLTKGGIFVSGLWLPLTHSESETPVSAMLSGVVVKAGIFPLMQFALLVDSINPVVRLFGMGTALLGVSYAVFEKDSKRMLAFHTISQLGFVLAAPAVGGFYALSHGLVKSVLFLLAGNLPTRNFKELKKTGIATNLWIPLAIASFSISGLPLLAGYSAKVLTLKNIDSWQEIGMNIAAVGTAISFSKFLFLPHSRELEGKTFSTDNWGFWAAISVLIGGLFVTNIFYLDAYKLSNFPKALITIAIGWGAYWLIFQRISIKLPRVVEKFEHLVGVMSLVLTGLFWIVWA